MKVEFREVVYGSVDVHGKEVFIGADIGGTNSNFGFFTVVSGKPHLLFSLHTKSQQIGDFTAVVQDLLAYVKEKYIIAVKKACFGAAGAVSATRDFVKPTNLTFSIDAQDILKKTDLSCALIINDFAIIGYGIDFVAPKDLICINKGSVYARGNKAIIGAGTGLGKAILLWNEHAGHYDPVSSEGGHADCAVQTAVELELVEYTRVALPGGPISWEDILSGSGITRMYQFFRDKSGYQLASSSPHPDAIFNVRLDNSNSAHTCQLYTLLYARCAKNLALDALALGGLYIAGGIAAKNVQMFQESLFMNEFINCKKQKKLLAHIPVWVIADYNVSLYGAMQYMILEGLCG